MHSWLLSLGIFLLISHHYRGLIPIKQHTQERDQVSAEVAAAQMQGYRNELLRQQRGRGGQLPGAGPRVREPEGGLGRDKVKDREMYRKRQAAGGGITSENIAVHERDWKLSVASLFFKPTQ